MLFPSFAPESLAVNPTEWGFAAFFDLTFPCSIFQRLLCLQKSNRHPFYF